MVQRVLELVWWRERGRLEQRSGQERDISPGPEQRSSEEREGSIDCGGRWTVESRRQRERVSPERERVDERNGKVKKVWESKKKLGK